MGRERLGRRVEDSCLFFVLPGLLRVELTYRWGRSGWETSSHCFISSLFFKLGLPYRLDGREGEWCAMAFRTHTHRLLSKRLAKLKNGVDVHPAWVHKTGVPPGWGHKTLSELTYCHTYITIISALPITPLCR